MYFNFFDFIKLMRKKFFSIIWFFGAFSIIGSLYVGLIHKPIYKAEGSVSFSIQPSPLTLTTIARTAKSSIVIENSIKSLTTKNPDIIAINNIEFEHLIENIYYSALLKDNTIDLSFKSNSEEFSIAFLNELMDNMVEFSNNYSYVNKSLFVNSRPTYVNLYGLSKITYLLLFGAGGIIFGALIIMLQVLSNKNVSEDYDLLTFDNTLYYKQIVFLPQNKKELENKAIKGLIDKIELYRTGPIKVLSVLSLNPEGKMAEELLNNLDKEKTKIIVSYIDNSNEQERKLTPDYLNNISKEVDGVVYLNIPVGANLLGQIKSGDYLKIIKEINDIYDYVVFKYNKITYAPFVVAPQNKAPIIIEMSNRKSVEKKELKDIIKYSNKMGEKDQMFIYYESYIPEKARIHFKSKEKKNNEQSNT